MRHNRTLTILLGLGLASIGYILGGWNYSKKQPAITDDNVNLPAIEEADVDDAIYTSEELATINLFEEAAPSVVFITTTTVQRDFWSMRAMEIPQGTGTGFFWDKQGHIVTNYHVIQNARRIHVTLADQSSYEATYVGGAPEKDLAVLKLVDVERSKIKPIKRTKRTELRVGQNTYAIGNPFGLDQTLTTGIVSALGREIESVTKIPIKNVIQTDAAINPGNSGGPLLNSSGELIGVNTAIYSPSGAYAGVGFSIPHTVVAWVVPDLIAYGKIKRPQIGIEFATAHIHRRLGISEGLLIWNMNENGAAQRAGLLPTRRLGNGQWALGDLLISIDDKPINSYSDFILLLEGYDSGDVIRCTVERDGQLFIRELTLQ